MKSYFESKVDSVKKWPRVLRVSLGILLMLGGVLGFFPVLGFWMIPLGLIILAVDFRWARHALVNLRWRLRAMRRRFFFRRNRERVRRAGTDRKRPIQPQSGND
ncbi:MAG: PGPGW domain-containing protein [Gammaproteobacteria bacterium]|nr:PGPGW domain-containing protein [Gammaproteobacteria bacterium]